MLAPCVFMPSSNAALCGKENGIGIGGVSEGQHDKGASGLTEAVGTMLKLAGRIALG